MYYDEEFKIDLPERSDLSYYAIEKYADYEYTYCVAYEMMIRTKEFDKLMSTNINERDNKWEQEAQALGLHISSNNAGITKDNSTPLSFIINQEEKLLFTSWFSLTISDVEHGIEKLINYYIEKEEIYLVNENDETQDRYKKVGHVDFLNILFNLDRFAIPCITNSEFLRGKFNGQKVIYPISRDIPLKILETEFLATLNPSEIKHKYIQMEPYYNRPTLRFEQSKIINLPVNLNLSEEELRAYISKVKQDYDKGRSIIKNPLELLGQQFEKATEPNSSKKFPKKEEKRKVAMADAFYVYDLYKILTPIFETKQAELRKKRDGEIKEIKQSWMLDNAQKETLIENIKSFYKTKLEEFSKDELTEKIRKIIRLPSDTVRTYKSFMNEYIKEGKYKELITGTTSN